MEKEEIIEKIKKAARELNSITVDAETNYNLHVYIDRLNNNSRIAESTPFEVVIKEEIYY